MIDPVKAIPESNNRLDWPRLVARAINKLRNELNAEKTKTTDSLQQLTFTPIATPSSPVEGQTYMDSTSHKLRTYDGTAWQDHW